LRTHALRVLLGYTLLGLLLTWPLVARFATHVPGDGIDDPSLAWNLWWVKHALVDQPQNVFQVGWQFWPIGINLALYTLTVLNGMLSVPLQAASGIVPAYNLLLLSSFVLSGFGAYLLCREFLRRKNDPAAEWAAFIGGALYAFASAKLFYAALGQGNIASSQWAPFAALYMWRAARPGGRWKDAGMAALFLGLQAYAELTYASFLLIFAGIAFLWGLLQRRQPARLLGRFIAIGALFAVLLAPVLLNMLPDLRAEGDFLHVGRGVRGHLLGGPRRVSRPNHAASPAGRDRQGVERERRRGRTAFRSGQGTAYLCRVSRAGARTCWRMSEPETGGRPVVDCVGGRVLPADAWAEPAPRRARHGHSAAVPDHGATAVFQGEPVSQPVQRDAPVEPRAAGSDGRVCASARRGWGEIRWVFETRLLHASGLLIALMLFEHSVHAACPSFDLRAPGLYERVAIEPGDFALLELPLGWRNGARVAGKQDVLIMDAALEPD
jgi:hypothetical protein